MLQFFSVDTVFFTVLGYPMSYLEFFGTVLNLWCVWLAARNRILTWPVGIVAVVLFFILFYQIRLYSDMFEQAYFFVTGFWGWWMWTHPKNAEKLVGGEKRIVRASFEETATALAVTVAGGLVLGAFMARIHLFFPNVFTVAADYPYLDAVTTVMSFVATVLMMRKRIDCWYYWILVDIAGVWLYFVKDVKFIALEYLIFLVMATAGLFAWRKKMRQHQDDDYDASHGTGGRQVLPAA